MSGDIQSQMPKNKKYRPSVFIVTYLESKEKIKYLLLHRVLHWKGWEFPKGGIDEKEDTKKAIERELKEETGLKALKIIEFDEEGKFDYDREIPERSNIVGQRWKLYSARVGKEKVEICNNEDNEHDDYKWLEFREAYDKLEWPDQKKCLEIVDDYLKKS